ncbi:MAG: hypothetical protein APG12_01557 [Candidatus Methanofastidiosum methylothiophilum]|uniref:Uncharacterized protein n=1 Tax=Candidatus Methanofastidiosum methylothiophilum TaxID=1705564 RepID=A0A150IPK2_9EURY|nr:MAG: hypothetical protein APG10_01574 [Candidatus Methanofastidiosum methylthiophilus]KYC46880.1 MAG: hypothetical protein APG11_01599 [Candidatus Methanofastidiosum methylthiophilus]KYC49309.1 MAG: hypothetical protein APG12_01557 [Candidatus Methanofastidiosum methylthiophilus]
MLDLYIPLSILVEGKMVTHESLRINDYYLWKKYPTYSEFPWNRSYLNVEFLEYEKKRVNIIEEWYKEFNRSENGKSLEEISLYVVPISMDSSWNVAIESQTNSKPIGLSALFNTPIAISIGLVPSGNNVPDNYSLINITKSKKSYVFNEKLNKSESAILIECWEELPSDSIYLDVPYEKRIIENLFTENLPLDKGISRSFQAPILSAPYDGNIGGISLSSLSWNSKLAIELMKVIQLMVPPEYRDMAPPKRAINGISFDSNGIKYKLSESPKLGHNILSKVYSDNYDKLSQSLSERDNFEGEYSLVSSIKISEGTRRQRILETFRNFTQTEITLADIDQLLTEEDMYIRPLLKSIDEDLWIQVVHAHQNNPAEGKNFDKEYHEIIELLSKDYNVLLADKFKQEKTRELIIRSMLNKTSYNIKRLAQSFARADDKKEITNKYLKDSRNTILDNFERLMVEPSIKKEIDSIKDYESNERYNVVQVTLINNPTLTVMEIYNEVKSSELFKSEYDLQELLDWMHKKGHVIKDSQNRYSFIFF